jgi:PleD family two-component response regulator
LKATEPSDAPDHAKPSTNRFVGRCWRDGNAVARALEQRSKVLSAYAERDSLAELFNKRGMMMAMTRELNAALRCKSHLSLCDLAQG